MSQIVNIYTSSYNVLSRVTMRDTYKQVIHN